MMVQKRYFFHTSGFDPYDAAAQYRRFVRELARFAATWNVKAQVSAAHENSAADGRWTVTAQGPGDLNSTASISASSTISTPSSERSASKPPGSARKREQNSRYEHDNGLRAAHK
jgi:hypothetical protein